MVSKNLMRTNYDIESLLICELHQCESIKPYVFHLFLNEVRGS